MFFVNIFLKSMRKVTTLTKLCRLSPVGHVPSTGGSRISGSGNLPVTSCTLTYGFLHGGLFSLGGDSKANNRCHREINKSESSKSPTALDSFHAFLNVMGRCRVSAPRSMWLDLDVDQSDGDGNRNTASVSQKHVNMAESCLLREISTFDPSKTLKAYLRVGWRGSEAELLDVGQ